MGNWKDRLRAEIDAQGTSMKAVSVKAGFGETYVRDILTRRGGGNVEGRQAIARALGKNQNWLISNDEDTDDNSPPSTVGTVERAAPPSTVHLRGEVAANRWFEVDSVFDDEPDAPEIPFIPGRFKGLSQVAFKVRGQCMDLKRIANGDFIICVDYFDARSALTSGDIVVAERRRGQLVEWTCKELVVLNRGFELRPHSTNPRHQTAISVASQQDPHEQDGTVVEVRWLVVGRFSPI